VLYNVTHRTAYEYDSTVALSHHLAHLRPRALPRQEVLESSLQVEPEPALSVKRVDFYGNTAEFLTIESAHRELVVTARSRVRVRAPELPEPGDTIAWNAARELCAADVLTPDTEVGEFRFDSPYIPRRAEFSEYALASFPNERPLLEGIVDFIRRIYLDFKFDARATTIATPLDEVLKERKGVCQDFAHFAIACLRSIGLPARYVSGYLETFPPLGKPRLVGSDASHAWFAIWCPGFGWIDADPTNNLLPGDRHVTVAWGRDFSDVSPIRGVIMGGGEHELEVSVDMQPVEENSGGEFVQSAN
jgi:transglutaminase-like putative cysteine protease